MSFSDYVTYAAIMALIGYGVYCIYDGVKRIKAFNEAKAQYMSTRKPGEYTYMKNYMIWATILLCGFFFCVYYVYDYAVKKDLVYCLAYVFITMLCMSLMMENIVNRQAYFDNKGIFFAKAYYEYKMIQDVKRKKGIAPVYDVKVIGHDAFRMDRKVAEELIKRLDAYKAEKKNKKK